MSRPESFSERFAARFQDQRLVDRYHLRPTYPPELITLLTTLIVDEPRAVLDIGCGTGNIARPLAPFVERVDAADMSEAMLARARTLPGGDTPNIRWILGRAEEVATRPPYALITAGASLHWMDWDVVLPRMAEMLTPHGALANAWVDEAPAPWSATAEAIRRRFTTNPTYASFDMLGELARRGLLEPLGEREATEVMRQPVADYITAQHARSAFALDAMTPEAAAQFDAEMEALLTPYATDGVLTFSVIGGVAWGKPLRGASPGGEGGGAA